MKFPVAVKQFVISLSALAAFAMAEPVLMEGVAAVVDGKPIMRSEFLNNLYRFQETPEGSAMSEADQRKYVLDQMIEEKVLLSRIDRDSIVITDAEVDQRVNAHLSQLAASQNTDLATLEKAIRAQLGISMAQYRDQLSKQIRNHIEMARVRQRHVGSVTPTKKEVDAFFANYKDSIPQQFNCVLLSHIQLPIEPDSMIVDSVKRIADALIDTLNLGMSFELLAKAHSQDTLKVESGKLDAKDVLVGVYNPLIARGKVKDKMADKSKGNVGEFKAKAKHKLKLVPLEGNWDGAVEDEYFDDESPRYLAIEVNE